MNIIDIIILCCLVPAVIRGISKGFVNQAYSLVALIAGVWLSFKFSGALGDWLVRGALSASGLTTSELRPLLPEGSRRVGTIRDLRGGLSGISGPVTRYASSLVLEAV